MTAENKLSRRQLFKKLAIPLGMATLELSGLLALFLSDRSKVNPTDTVVKPTDSPPKKLMIEPTFPLKEIAEKNLAVKESGSFFTNDIVTTWTNLTDSHFIEKSAKDIFLYFEKLQSRMAKIPYVINEITYTNFSITKTKASDRLFLILPEEVTMPKYQNDQNFETPSLTYTLDGGKKHISYIRINSSRKTLPKSATYDNETEDANLKFLIEACQSSIKVTGDSEGLDTLGQEIVCNSLAIAVFIKQKGMSFSDYTNWASDVTIGPTPKEQYPLMVIPEEEYNNIPEIENAIEYPKVQFKTSRTPID